MRLLAFLLAATAASAGVTESAKVLEEKTADLPPALRQAFRMGAAASLREPYPELARRFIDLTLADARETGALEPGTMHRLAEVAPEESVALLPYLKAGSDGPLVNDLIYWHHTATALKLYRAMLTRGHLAILQANALLGQVLKENPADAVKLFGEILAQFHFDRPDPQGAWALLNCAGTMAQLAPGPAADACERLAKAAAPPDYGKDVPATTVYGFQVGSKDISTSNPREAVLIFAGARLHALAPDRFERLQPLFAAWDLNGPLTVKPTRRTNSATGAAAYPREAALDERMRHLRGDLTDSQRSQLAIDLANGIRALPAGGTKSGLALGLANLSTEGDLGHAALTAVAETLAQSLHETPGYDYSYLELATLIRYEHLALPDPDPATRAAEALLELRDEIHRHAGFALTALDGQPYSLDALRGKVVLLNFWATWCPPCRKEMPDMEKLYQAFQKQGLVVLAVSDEERETVAGFLAKQNYTFPVLLDPDKKVQRAFDVEGIPKSFIFDRQGRLVAQAMDMRTERQFRELLKSAGLE